MYIIRFPQYNFQEGSTVSNITQSIYISFFPRTVFIRNNISVSGSMRPAPKSRIGLKSVTIQRHCFQVFLCTSKHRTKQRHNAPFRFIASKSSRQFQIVHTLSDCMLQRHYFHFFLCSFKYHQNTCFRHIIFQKNSLQFHSFQIPPQCLLQRYCFIVFSAVPKRFKYCQIARSTLSQHFQNIISIASECTIIPSLFFLKSSDGTNSLDPSLISSVRFNTSRQRKTSDFFCFFKPNLYIVLCYLYSLYDWFS